MTRFTKGPADGILLALARSPKFLRVTRSQAGEWDALDLLADKAKAGEMLYAYRLTADRGTVRVCGRDANNRPCSGVYALADYEFIAEQPADSIMRDTESWRAWTRQAAKAIPGLETAG